MGDIRAHRQRAIRDWRIVTLARIVPSDRLRQAALIVWIAVGSVVLGYVAIILADSVRIIWLPIAFAAGLVLLLEPAVEVFERFHIPRIAGTILSFLILAASIVVAITLISHLSGNRRSSWVNSCPNSISR